MTTSLNIAKNYIRRIIREPLALFFLLAFPIIGSSLGIIITSFYDEIKIGVNFSPSENYKLYKMFDNIDKFNLVYYPYDILEKNDKKYVGIIFLKILSIC